MVSGRTNKTACVYLSWASEHTSTPSSKPPCPPASNVPFLRPAPYVLIKG